MATLFPVDYTKSFAKLTYVVRVHNAKVPLLKDRVRQPVLATAKELIRIYGLSLLKSRGISPLKMDTLPSLRTNNKQLSKLLLCSSRTIQRHIIKLVEVGIILSKKTHGSNSSYELWFSKEILSINGLKASDNSKNRGKTQKTKSTGNQFFKNLKTTTCRHTDTGYTTGNMNNILIDVQKNMDSLSLKSKNSYGNITGNTSGHTREKVSKKILTREKVHKRDTRQTGAEISVQSTVSRSTFLAEYVDDLWQEAHTLLYYDQYLLEFQIKQAKEKLQLWYEPVASDQLFKVHTIYKERLELARKYIAKDPLSRFIPPPYLYFDPTNKNGFAGTRAWWKSHKRRQYQTRLKLITQAQIRRFKANENKPTGKQKPRLALFQECELRISKLKSPELLQSFYKSVLTPSTYGLIHQNNTTL